MESSVSIGNILIPENRKNLLTNVPTLPEQVGQPNFQRLSDTVVTPLNQFAVILDNAVGRSAGEELSHNLHSMRITYISNDPAWNAVSNTPDTYKLVGPPGEIFTNQISAIVSI